MARASGIALLSLIMAFAAGGLQADVLNLADGSRIVGTIERLDGAEATLSGTFAGELKVPRGTIVSIETDQPVTVQLGDGAYLTGTLSPAEGGGVVFCVRLTCGCTRPIARIEPKHSLSARRTESMR